MKPVLKDPQKEKGTIKDGLIQKYQTVAKNKHSILNTYKHKQIPDYWLTTKYIWGSKLFFSFVFV